MSSAASQQATLARGSAGRMLEQQHGDGKEEAAEPPAWARALRAQMQTLQTRVDELCTLRSIYELPHISGRASPNYDDDDARDELGGRQQQPVHIAASGSPASTVASTAHTTAALASTALSSTFSPHRCRSRSPAPSSSRNVPSSALSSPPSAVFSTRWLSWAGDETVALRALALFLPFADGDPFDRTAYRYTPCGSSFLSLARTCRSAYQLLTSDAACWATQRLRFDFEDRVLCDSFFPPRYGVFPIATKHVLVCSSLTERRREILRRLLGAEAYERVITPLTARVEQVRFAYKKQQDGYFRVQRDAAGKAIAAAYSHFTKRALALPELERQGLAVEKHRAEWMYASYSFLLLPACIRLAPAASISLTYGQHDAQTACLNQLLQRLPSVEQLALDVSEDQRGWHTVGWDWTSLHQRLPRLRALTLRNVDMDKAAAFWPLLTARHLGELRSLSIDFCYGYGHLIAKRSVFSFSPQADEAPSAVDSEHEPLASIQLRLQLALCRHVRQQFRVIIEDDGIEAMLLRRQILDGAMIERDLLARQQAAEEKPAAKRARIS